MSEIKDPYDDQLRAARYRAERDQAREELDRAGRRTRCLESALQEARCTRAEDREAGEWVRGHGGIDVVEKQWGLMADVTGIVGEALWGTPDRVPDDLDEDELRAELLSRLMPAGYAWDDRFAGAVDFYETMHDLLYTIDCEEEHDGPEMVREVMRRLMPEGYEWPRFEDGARVKFGDVVSDGDETGRVYYVTFDAVNPVIIGFTDETPDQDPGTWLEVSVSDGERVKRPAKVLDADGEEIRVGDTVYHVKDGSEMTVYGIEGEWLVVSVGGRVRHDIVTHHAPVLAADGRPLREGEHVYHVETGAELVVKELPKPGEYQAIVVFAPPTSHLTSFDPDQLTHERQPVLAADGEPLEVGQTVWSVNDGREYKVVMVDRPVQFDTSSIKVDDGKAAGGVWIRPDNLTHRRPVLDADGVPTYEGDTIWNITNLSEWVVSSIDSDGHMRGRRAGFETKPVPLHDADRYSHQRPVLDAEGVRIELGDDLYSVEGGLGLHVSNIDRSNGRIATSAMLALDKWADPSMFTHTKPGPPDSWERIEEDTGKTTCDYFDQSHGCGECPHYPSMCSIDKARDLVRRAKALAERGQ